MKTFNDSPLKVIKLQRNSDTNFSQEVSQLAVGIGSNNKRQMQILNCIDKVRSISENLKQNKKIGTSYSEQLTLTTLTGMLYSNNNTSIPHPKNTSTEQYQIQQQLKSSNTDASSQALNESKIKINKKRVVISALRMRTEIVKNLEEEVDAMDCESIVHEELKRYRRLRTDSILQSDNQSKEEILKQLQLMIQNNSAINSPLRRQSNALNTSKGQRDIKSLQASQQFTQLIKKQLGDIDEDKKQNGGEQVKSEEEKQDLIRQTPLQKSLTEFDEEIYSINRNSRSIYDKTRRILNSKRYLASQQQQQAQQQDNTQKQLNQQQYFSSEGVQDISINANSNIQQLPTQIKNNWEIECGQKITNKEFNVSNILCTRPENKEEFINLWKTKIYTPEERQRNLTKAKSDFSQIKRSDEQTGNNFGIFKNSYLQQMQTESCVKSYKHNFVQNDSSYYMTDADTAYSKQSSELSTKKSSCESDEILGDKNKIQLLLPSPQQLTSQSSSQNQDDIAVLADLLVTPNRLYSVQKHQNSLDRGSDHLNYVKNSYVPPFSFGANGYLNTSSIPTNQVQNTSNSNNINYQFKSCNTRRPRKSRSITPMKVTRANNESKYIPSICISTQPDQIMMTQSAISSSKDCFDNKQNKQPMNGDPSKYKLNNVRFNNNNNNNNNNSKSNNRNCRNNKSLDKQSIESQNETEVINYFHQNSKISKRCNLTTHTPKKYNSFLNDEQSPLNEFRQKLLSKVVNNVIAQKQVHKECQIGDKNSNTFQIRKINTYYRQNSDCADTSQQQQFQNSSSFYQSIGNNAVTQAKVNILNFENKDLKLNKDKSASTNIQLQQEKLNNLLRKKYKYTSTKKYANTTLQNQLMQDCHNKVFAAEDDIAFFSKNLIEQPSRIKKITATAAASVEVVPL